jgi:small-conductance mechanosensitive channel
MAIVAVSVILAHWLSVRLVLGAPGPGRSIRQSFVATTAGPSRLALVVLALWAALPSTGFPVEVSRSIGQVLSAALVVLLGWSATRALGVAAGLYLRRFRLDAEDNLLARKHVTQVRVLKRAGDILIGLVTVAAALMSFPSVRAYGVSLFASAGAAGLVVGLAARPLLTNLIAGVQIAVTQPIRLEDTVVVEGERGWVEEITSTYVVVRLWAECPPRAAQAPRGGERPNSRFPSGANVSPDRLDLLGLQDVAPRRHVALPVRHRIEEAVALVVRELPEIEG